MKAIQSFKQLPSNIRGKKITIFGESIASEKASAFELAENGARLLILARHQTDLDQIMAGLRRLGHESSCYGMVFDPADPMDQKISATVIERLFRGMDYTVFMGEESNINKDYAVT